MCDLCAVMVGGGAFALILPLAPFRIHATDARSAVSAHIAVIFIYAVMIVLLNHAHLLYSPYQLASRRAEVHAILKSVFYAAVLTTTSICALGSKEISPLVICGTVIWSFVSMASWRQCRRHVLHTAIADGLTCHNVLIIGTDSLADAVHNYLSSHPHLGFVVLGRISVTADADCVRDSSTIAPLGTFDDLARLCRTHFVDEIIVCTQKRHIVKAIIEKARDYDVGVRVVPDLYDGMACGAQLDYLGAFPILGIVTRDIPTITLKLKRALDVTLSALSLALLSPLLLVIAFMIMVDSPGPAFHVSQRVARKGRVFSCFKFRTMVADAETLKSALQHLNERDAILFKISHDPRVTRVGRYLRKYSLDELPQLWNVLTGEMSLVGPRPPLASEVEQYELDYYRRLQTRPGITGLWQVEARTSPSFEHYINLDLKYVNGWSLKLDLKILCRTLAVVLGGTGS